MRAGVLAPFIQLHYLYPLPCYKFYHLPLMSGSQKKPIVILPVMCYTSICTSVTVAVFNEATMNALTPVRHVSGVDEPQASRTVYVRAEHIFALACALATAFDLSDLRRLAVTSLSVALDNVVPVEGRTVAQIAFDLTSYATDSAPGGIKHLLEGALALNPRNPDLLELAAPMAGSCL